MPALHEGEGFVAGDAGQRGRRPSVHHIADAPVEGDTTQQAAADVAVDKPSGVVDDHRRLITILGDGLERVPNGGARGNEPSAV
jgi:hypothetical protein